jgi:hypothetical protein
VANTRDLGLQGCGPSEPTGGVSLIGIFGPERLPRRNCRGGHQPEPRMVSARDKPTVPDRGYRSSQSVSDLSQRRASGR